VRDWGEERRGRFVSTDTDQGRVVVEIEKREGRAAGVSSKPWNRICMGNLRTEKFPKEGGGCERDRGLQTEPSSMVSCGPISLLGH